VPRIVFKQAETIPESKKADLLRARRDAFWEATDKLSENVRQGRITLGMFEEDMRTRLRKYLGGTAMISKGGVDNMTPSDWGKVGAELKKQYKWLHGFMQAIYENRENVTVAAIKARARMYGEAGMKMAHIIQARDVVDHLPWIPKDGSTECLNRCKCTWHISITSRNEDAGTKTVQAIWTLHPAEHCPDCVGRDGHTVTFDVPANADVPSTVGYGV
jgi:hypothetical protein